jgi:hypothetical protein
MLAKQSMDIQTLGMIGLAVAVVAVVLYVWDRRTKQQGIDYTDAAKLALGVGAGASGIAYAVGTPDIAETVASTAEMVQEMFTGKPEF